MQIILKEKIRNLGDLGENVKVKPGYARNYLLPKGKALRATKTNIDIFEKQRKELEKVAKEKLAAAEKQAEQLNDIAFTIKAKAGEGGKLFGSIGTRDVAELVSAKGVEVAKHQVRMPNGVIRETGEIDINIQLHTDVDTKIKLVVEAE